VHGLVRGLPGDARAAIQQRTRALHALTFHGTAAGLFRTAQYIGAIASSSLISLLYGQQATTHGLHIIAVVLGALSALLFLGTMLDRRLRRASCSR
jgi:hypothetical protein